MQILVTGATGFIGRHLCNALLDQGHFIRALVRDPSRLESLEGRVTPFVGDICEPDSLEGVEENVDAVLHLAALGHVSAISEEAFRNFVRVNVEGTRNLLDRFVGRDIQRFVHVSSTAAMGLIRKPLVSEADPPRPTSPYQKSKVESERAALSYHREHGLPVCVVRPCMVYGIGGEGEFLKQSRLMKKGVFPKVGLGKNLTPLVHVRDVVQGIIKAMERAGGGETYLLCGADSVVLDEMRTHIVRALDVTWRPYPFVPAPVMRLGASLVEKVAAATGGTPVVTRANIENTIFDRRFDISKARRELGYEPRVAPAEGIPETVRWFIQTGRV